MKESKKLYPFDQYTRSTYIKYFIQRIAKDVGLANPRVLDLGGYKGKMDEFLEGMDLNVMDIYDVEEEGYMKGDARNTQLPDGAYDFVCMSDVMEHIPDNDRASALKEAVRISKYGTIICFPYYQKKTILYENVLNHLYEYLTGNAHQWIGEHVDLTLPSFDRMKKVVAGIEGVKYLEFKSNDVDIWFNTILLNFLIFEEKFPSHFIFQIFQYYNSRMKDIDICSDGYRVFFCIWKTDQHYTVKDFTHRNRELTPEMKDEVRENIKKIISDFFISGTNGTILNDKQRDILQYSYYSLLSETIANHATLYNRLYENNLRLNYENKLLNEKIATLSEEKHEYPHLFPHKKESFLHLFFVKCQRLFTKEGRENFTRKGKKAIKILFTQGPVVFLKKVRTYFVYITNFQSATFVGDLKNALLPEEYPVPSVKNLIDARFLGLKPINTIYSPSKHLRVNVMIPALSQESMFGGVMTALTFSTLLASKLHARLRIICTEGAVNDLSAYYTFAKLFHLPQLSDVEIFEGAPRFTQEDYYKLELSENDLFIATFWSTSYLARQCNLRKKFIYLVQEFEPIFYINGDEQLLVKESYAFGDMIPVINSKILYDYFGKYGYAHMKKNGLYFEPAFPDHIFAPSDQSFSKKEKYKLFFYSRPNIPRNLFYRGIQLIDKAILLNILDTQKWEIHFVGQDIPPLVFSDGSRPVITSKLGLVDYANFIAKIDLGISLMEAPHPSYPPLDLIASGAVVLTNNYDIKKNLPYSSNLIFSESSLDELLRNLKYAIRLAEDNKKRGQNYAKAKLSRNWETTFEPIVDELHTMVTNNSL